MSSPISLDDEVLLLRQRVEVLESNINGLREVNDLVNKNFRIVVDLLTKTSMYDNQLTEETKDFISLQIRNELHKDKVEEKQNPFNYKVTFGGFEANSHNVELLKLKLPPNGKRVLFIVNPELYYVAEFNGNLTSGGDGIEIIGDNGIKKSINRDGVAWTFVFKESQ